MSVDDLAQRGPDLWGMSTPTTVEAPREDHTPAGRCATGSGPMIFDGRPGTSLITKSVPAPSARSRVRATGKIIEVDAPSRRLAMASCPGPRPHAGRS